MNQYSNHMLQFAGTPYGNIMYLVNCTDAQWQEILDMMAESNEYTNDVCKKANDLWEKANRLMDQCKIDGDPKTLEESIKYKEQAELWEKKTYELIKTPQFNADVFIEFAEKNGITYDTQLTHDRNKGAVGNLLGRIRARFCSQGRAKKNRRNKIEKAAGHCRDEMFRRWLAAFFLLFHKPFQSQV